mmetsp:Transcript_56255/g.89586  ORF Transcript_56255/g.89586 Transcript_56255/m.89586 type:complete len:252 (-) Transcript_56255:181-936(-)
MVGVTNIDLLLFAQLYILQIQFVIFDRRIVMTANFLVTVSDIELQFAFDDLVLVQQIEVFDALRVLIQVIVQQRQILVTIHHVVFLALAVLQELVVKLERFLVFPHFVIRVSEHEFHVPFDQILLLQLLQHIHCFRILLLSVINESNSSVHIINFIRRQTELLFTQQQPIIFQRCLVFTTLKIAKRSREIQVLFDDARFAQLVKLLLASLVLFQLIHKLRHYALANQRILVVNLRFLLALFQVLYGLLLVT